MNRVFAVAVLVCLSGPAGAQDRKPGAAPKGIDKATADAWGNRGFVAGWMRELDGRLVRTTDYPDDDRATPALWYDEETEREIIDDDLKNLPAVDVPFALILTTGRADFTDAGVAHLATLANLKRLDVHCHGVTGHGLKRLADLKHLTTLKLNFTGVSDACVKHLAGFKNLTHLSLAHTKVSDAGLKELAALKNLTALDLGATKVTDNGLKHLAALKHLAELTLSHTAVSDAGLNHLAGLTNLATLNLWMTDVEGKNLKPLAGMKKLTTFGVENIKYDEEVLGALAEMGLLHALPGADFYVYKDADRSVEGGKRPTNAAEVRSFRFIARESTGEGVKYLAAFKNLEYLSLGREQVTPDGLKYAAELTSLKSLSLESATHAADGLKHLAGMKNLAVLHVGGGELSREDIERAAAIKSLTHLYLWTVGDDTLHSLQEAGALHKLWCAKAANGRRATADDEIVSLDLRHARVRGEGLKAVARLKNIASIDVRDLSVSREALEEFARARPKCEIVK